MTATRVVHALAFAIVAAGSLMHPAAAQSIFRSGLSPAIPNQGSPRGCAEPAVPELKTGLEFAWQPRGEARTALSGRHVSRLELVSRKQARFAARPPLRLAAAALPTGPVPGAAGCGQLVLRRSDRPSFHPGRGLSPEDFLGSKRLQVSRTHFDRAWSRVQSAALPRSRATRFAGFARSLGDERLLAEVNAYANRHIRYVDDRALYGRPDYWANAGATLARGAGDCEDIAIAKLQLLAAAGVPRRDMYLTIAYDPLRNADHAVLIVRFGGRHWLLDNSSDRVVDAAEPLSYRPIFSFGSEGRWLHGY